MKTSSNVLVFVDFADYIDSEVPMSKRYVRYIDEFITFSVTSDLRFRIFLR